MEVCVFCSSKSNVPQPVFTAATEFSQWLVKNNHGLVYGGGSCGLMAHFADTVLAGGGAVTGVYPERAFDQEVEHQGLTKMILTKDMLDRKREMMQASDCFVVFPGGIGTMDEALEVITWKTVYDITKPVYFYNADGFWNPFLQMLKSYETTGLFYPKTMASFQVFDRIEELIGEIHAQK